MTKDRQAELEQVARAYLGTEAWEADVQDLAKFLAAQRKAVLEEIKEKCCDKCRKVLEQSR